MKIAIISLGCPKNQVDADVFCHSLLLQGHTTTADLWEADAILVNTCGFIESGLLRDWVRLPHGYTDAYLMQKIAANPSRKH